VHGAARRKLDGFQLFTGFRWANSQQLAANALGAAVLFAAMVFSSAATGMDLNVESLLVMAALSFLGGVLAPVVKDLVVALKRVRTGG
jgi:hypothetical protein